MAPPRYGARWWAAIGLASAFAAGLVAMAAWPPLSSDIPPAASPPALIVTLPDPPTAAPLATTDPHIAQPREAAAETPEPAPPRPAPPGPLGPMPTLGLATAPIERTPLHRTIARHAAAAPRGASPASPAQAVAARAEPLQPPRMRGSDPALIRLDIPVRLDRLPLGEVGASLSATDELVAFDGPALLKLLERYVLPSKLAALRARIGAANALSVADLLAEGIAVVYDAAAVEASLDIPLGLRTTQSLSLTGAYGAEGRPDLSQADVSGYVNLLVGRDFLPAREGAQPVVVDFDGAVNVLGTVLEGVTTYRDAGTVRWARGDTRLVHDDPESRTRYSAGDIAYATEGFQTRQRAAGIAIGRNFGLQPYRSSAPVGQTDLDLDRNSRVDIIVNGQRMRTIDLGPGRYNVRDLPLVGGTNDVTLRVTDEVGRVDVIRFPFVFDASVLAAGEQDFGYAAGVASEPTASGRKYDTGDRVFSAFHTFGLTDQLTLGANAQASKTVRTIGGEARLATAFGNFRLDATATDTTFAGSGAAARLQHRFTESSAPGGMGRSISSTLTYRSRSFASLGQQSASNPVALALGALYSQRIFGDLYGSLGVSRQIPRMGEATVTSVDASLSYQIAPDVTAALLMSSRQASFGGNDQRAFLSISWFPRGSNQRYGASYDTDAQSRRVDWAYAPMARVDAVEADVSLKRDHLSDGYDGRIGYTGYRFDTGLSQATTAARGDGGGSNPRTSVTFGTALAFAGPHLAVTRPITDSFALFVPHRTLSGKVVEVNPMGDKPEARTDLLGTAVLPELASHYRHHVVIAAPDLPLGFDLGRDVYELQPGYRSGTVVPLGTGAVVLGDGILVDATGKELPLELGTIVSLAEPPLPPIEFFTSKTGRFRVEGLAPGRFRLSLANDPEKAIDFEVPEGSSGSVDLGRMTYPIVP